jgi:phenylacetate-coenzyme A ligase PaaK-like adenylate-forming protein
MFEGIASWYAKRKADEVARRAREALLSIPFYREKIKQNSVDIYDVKQINSIEKLDKFLQKYKIDWVNEKDLINENFSLDLSLVHQEKRIWIQTSSGYSLIERLKSGEPFFEMMKKFKRKKVAFTRNDMDRVIREIYLPGIKRLFPENITPTIAIFARLLFYGGSGTYPLISFTRALDKLPVRVLPYGEPLSQEQIYDYVIDSMENKTNGIITSPSILMDIGKFMIENGLKYENLRYVAVGGFRPTREVIEVGHKIGAEIVIDGYSVQECMPLGGIAAGIISSENEKFEKQDGMLVFGNLCHIRIVDKNGENVSEGEEGFIRVTAPFEGTSLIDYSTGDITKLLSYYSFVNFKGLNIKLPFPQLSYEIRRKDENFIKIREYPISISHLTEILSSHVGFNFLIYEPPLKDELFILLPDGLSENEYKEISKKIKYLLHPPFYKLLKIGKINESKLRKIVYPFNHHKPHNIITSLPKDLERELYYV